VTIFENEISKSCRSEEVEIEYGESKELDGHITGYAMTFQHKEFNFEINGSGMKKMQIQVQSSDVACNR
jgi:phage head maturation protease